MYAERRCKNCGEIFTPATGNQRYCGTDCAKAAEREQNKAANRTYKRNRKKANDAPPAPVKKIVTIREVIAWAEEHRKQTGECLSYGKAVERMREEGKA